MPRRIAICLAFATWCFLNTWVEFGEGGSAYFSRYDPLRAVVIPVLCWEFIIAGCMFGVWELWRRRGRPSKRQHALFLVACLAPVGIAATAVLRVLPLSLTPLVRSRLFWPVVLVAAIVPVTFAFRNPAAMSRWMRNLLLYSWPVLLVVLVQAGRRTLFKYSPESYADRPLAKPFPTSPSNVRVVWIIFDELAQGIAFDSRPANLQLPNLDRLKSGSFYASSARAPDVVTEKSLPGLILGEKVLADIREGPDTLVLRTPSRPEGFSWSSAANVFDRARELGFNTGLAGWYHPYGRLLNRSLTKCYWTAIRLNAGIEEPSSPRTLPSAMWDRARLQFSTLPLIGHIPGLSPLLAERRQKIEKFAFLLDRSLELVADASIGLVLLHLPVPHPPAISNRSTRAFATQGNIGYFDNVALADETLGILRRRMEQVGLWDRSAVLVSADHGWRTNVWRGGPDWNAAEEAASRGDTSGVPFLLKLPGQQTGVAYDKRFDTLVTQSLILDILRGKLKDATAIPDLIERAGGRE